MNSALTDYSATLRSRWRWVVWGVLVALLAVTVFLLVEPPVYRTKATVFIRTPGDVSTVVDGGDSYAQGRARTYAALADNPDLLARVAGDLALDNQPQTLQRRVRAKSLPGTVLIEFSVDAPSATEAQHTATVLLDEYSALVRNLESVPGSLVPRAEFVVVDPPGKPVRVVAWGMPISLLLLATTLVGMFLGAIGAVLRSILQGPRQAPEPETPTAERSAGDDAGEDDNGGSTGEGTPERQAMTLARGRHQRRPRRASRAYPQQDTEIVAITNSSDATDGAQK